ncbi:MAG TPA: DUF5684 domain-containing protein [Thermomicrobiaceae bacterium]|nr:DUF5684 domain-containing protein [Thermomicrobiaceae bacterium]
MGGFIGTLIYLAVIVLEIASVWMVFQKAGQQGWASIIPIYNTIVWLRIIGRPWWWLLLFLIPGVNLVLLIIAMLDLAKSFGKSTGFAVGLILLSFIFIPILGFGDALYLGPGGQPGMAGARMAPAA